MSDVSSRWKVRTTLEYTIPTGSHIAEIGKAAAMIEQEMKAHSLTGDVFVETDDEHVVLTAIVETKVFKQRPKFQVARGADTTGLTRRDVMGVE
jgi:hypothetical protein